MGTAVRARGLTRAFGDFIAVDDLSFEVAEGEIFGFLGPNGAGKTTTIKMLSGLLPPTSGRAEVAGYDVATQVDAIKHRIGYMSQLFSLYGDLTVGENIEFFARLYGVQGRDRDDRRRWVLDMAGLADHVDRLTAELPLGWKQRLALGCAVLHQPPILFLDEPTSGVDPISRRDFWDLIHEFSHRGTTVFVSTHYMEEAEYCHRLGLMNRGVLIALDTPERLRSGMTSPTLELRVRDAVAALPALEGLPAVSDVALFGRSLHLVVDDVGAAKEQVRAAVERLGSEILALERIEPSLEDVFVARVRAAGGAPLE